MLKSVEGGAMLGIEKGWHPEGKPACKIAILLSEGFD